MKKFYKVCITITTLIALFFFIKWINEVRPRYEWQESFTVDRKVLSGGWYYTNAKFCNEVEIETEFTRNGGSNIETGKANIYVCYIKEKVRIN